MNNGRYILILILVLLCSGYAQYELLPDSVWNAGAAAWDTNKVNQPVNAKPGGIATGRFFKGASDDTIRIIRFQTDLPWSDTSFIEIGTDTSASSFGPGKFSIEKVYATPVYFLYTNPVAVGNVDNDQYTDIVATCRPEYENRLLWIEWNPASSSWALRDSIVLPSLFLGSIAVGDADNDGQDNEIFLATSAQSVIRAVWTGSAWDTLTIPLDSARCSNVVIGDVRPDLAGNEVYAVGCNAGNVQPSRLWMIRWNGASWAWETIQNFDWPLDNTYALANDVALGDVDPTAHGNEIAVCFTHDGGGMPFIFHFHISILGWAGNAWTIKTWHWADDSMGLGCNNIEIGDLIAGNPGREMIVTCSGSRLFWLAPNGSAWMQKIPGSYEACVAVGDINRFRNIGDEMIIAGNYGYMEYESHDFANDIGVYYYNMHNKTTVKNLPDTIRAVIFNAGSVTQSGFNVCYRFKNSAQSGSKTYNDALPAGDTGFVKVPVSMDFLGMDTLYVYTSLATDAYRGNDTVKLHVEVYNESTYAATGFNSRIFPPVNGTTPPYDWTSVKTSGTGYIWWFRDKKPMYPPGPPLEGYAGARYANYGQPRFEHCRIRTPKFNTGDHAAKIFTKVYSFYDVWQEPMDPETLIVEYSYDDQSYTPILKFLYNSSLDGWHAHDVEIGDFPANTDLYVGIRVTSGGGGHDFFIDSIRVYGRPVSAVSESPAGQSIQETFLMINNGPLLCRSGCDIRYGLAEKTLVEISVYNAVGQHVRTIVKKAQKSGSYSAVWDGLDKNGRSIPSGIYLVRMSAASAVLTKKIIIVK